MKQKEIIKKLIEEKINNNPDNYPNVEKLKLTLIVKNKTVNIIDDINYDVTTFSLLLIYNENYDYTFKYDVSNSDINDEVLDNLSHNFCSVIRKFLYDLKQEKKLLN